MAFGGTQRNGKEAVNTSQHCPVIRLLKLRKITNIFRGIFGVPVEIKTGNLRNKVRIFRV